MAIDDDFEKDLQEERLRVNAKFAGQRRLSEEDIVALCPSKVDRDHLDSLMGCLTSCTNDAEAKARVMDQMQTGGEVVVRLLRKFLLG